MWIYIVLGIAGLIYSFTGVVLRRMYRDSETSVSYPDDISRLTEEMFANIAQVDTSQLTSDYDGLRWLLEDSDGPLKKDLYSSLNIITMGLEDHVGKKARYPFLPICVVLGLSQLGHLAKLQGLHQRDLENATTRVALFLDSIDEDATGPTDMDTALEKVLPTLNGNSLEILAILQLYIEISFLDAVRPDGAANFRDDFAGLTEGIIIEATKQDRGNILHLIVKVLEKTSRMIERNLEQ